VTLERIAACADRVRKRVYPLDTLPSDPLFGPRSPKLPDLPLRIKEQLCLSGDGLYIYREHFPRVKRWADRAVGIMLTGSGSYEAVLDNILGFLRQVHTCPGGPWVAEEHPGLLPARRVRRDDVQAWVAATRQSFHLRDVRKYAVEVEGLGGRDMEADFSWTTRPSS
jgi:hypothetical protein